MIKKVRKKLNRQIENKQIEYKEFQKIAKQTDGYVIDVRSHQEYEEGHLEGAISISLYDLANNILKEMPDKNRTILVYCESGNRSKEAQNILEQLGYKEVYNLKGGLDNI